MIERPLQFGSEGALIGVLSEPGRPASASPRTPASPLAPASTPDRPRVAFLLFNAGVLPRVGPHRMNVKLARALARAGQTSLRFDLSGQGDSRRAPGQLDFKDQALRDIRFAMDHLEQNEGIDRFALIGICSGAVNALRVAIDDARVVGVLMFDGHWYPARWSATVRRWKRLRQMRWVDVARLAVRRLRKPAAADPSVEAPAGDDDGNGNGLSPNPSRPEFVRGVQSLTDRGTALLFVYSGSVIDAYSYAGQFRDAFGREPFFRKVRIEYRPDIDHTFLTLETQRRMIGLVEHWVADVQQAHEALA